MKKVLYLSLILLLLSGCNKKLNNEKKDIEKSEPETNLYEKEIEEPYVEPYVDNNSIKIALYKGNNGTYKRVDRFESKVKEMEVIDAFSFILSNDEVVYGNGIKGLYYSIKETISDFDNYKIGYNIKFNLKDGRVVNENILKPLEYTNYGFCPYLYAWLYDDVHATGWHSHIEEDEYTDNTVMSSIKLMWGNSASEIDSNIELTVFSYDSDDFDELGNYRGISKFTTIIERK